MMRNTCAILFSFTFSICCSAQDLPATSVQKCDASVFMSRKKEWLNQTEIISYLDMIDKDNYSSEKKDTGITSITEGGLFSGEFTSFDEKRQKLKREINYHFDTSFSRDYAISTLDENGLAAYKACLLAKVGGNSLLSYISKHTSTDDLVTFHVVLKADTNFDRSLHIDVFGGLPEVIPPGFTNTVHVSTTGATLATNDFGIGDKQFTFRRISKNLPFRVVPQFNNAGLPSNDIFIPAVPTMRTIQVRKPVSKSGHYFTVWGPNAADRPTGNFSNGGRPLLKSGSIAILEDMACIEPSGNDWQLDVTSITLTPVATRHVTGTGVVACGSSSLVINTDWRVCHDIVLTSGRGDSNCDFDWVLRGTEHKEKSVFD
jgi:hypothetical protein